VGFVQGILLFDVKSPGGLFSAHHFINKQVPPKKYKADVLFLPPQHQSIKIPHIINMALLPILVSKSQKVEN
jgi:hypothetical protein